MIDVPIGTILSTVLKPLNISNDPIFFYSPIDLHYDKYLYDTI